MSHAARGPAPPPDIEVFASPRCPHCHAAKLFLEQLQVERPELTVIVHDVEADPEARERLPALSIRFGYRSVGVPTLSFRRERDAGSRADTMPDKLERHYGENIVSG